MSFRLAGLTWQAQDRFAARWVGWGNESAPMQTRNDFLGQVDGPELFIGLVGAIGTNLPLVVEALSEELRELSYDPHEIHLSHLIRPSPEFRSLARLDGGPQETRIEKYMDAGDALRRNMGSGRRSRTPIRDGYPRLSSRTDWKNRYHA